jgi:hypothetical protein
MPTPPFTPRLVLIAAALLAAPHLQPACAQHAGAVGAVPAPTTAPREAAQFDFLLGQWELELTPKVSGLGALIHGAPRLSGVWKAWKAFDGFGVEDELRIVDASANPLSLSHTLRVWDSRNRRWTLQGLDVYRARFSTSQGQWQDGEMRLTGTGNSPEGKPTLTRTRFFDITPNGFRMKQDRSLDDGATWEEGVLSIVARRTAAKAAR